MKIWTPHAHGTIAWSNLTDRDFQDSLNQVRLRACGSTGHLLPSDTTRPIPRLSLPLNQTVLLSFALPGASTTPSTLFVNRRIPPFVAGLPPNRSTFRDLISCQSRSAPLGSGLYESRTAARASSIVSDVGFRIAPASVRRSCGSSWSTSPSGILGSLPKANVWLSTNHCRGLVVLRSTSSLATPYLQSSDA